MLRNLLRILDHSLRPNNLANLSEESSRPSNLSIFLQISRSQAHKYAKYLLKFLQVLEPYTKFASFLLEGGGRGMLRVSEIDTEHYSELSIYFRGLRYMFYMGRAR